MQWEVNYLQTPRTRSFVAGASESDRGLGLVVGSHGVALRIEGQSAVASIAESTPDLTAAAMDVLDREWVASLGRLWVRGSCARSSLAQRVDGSELASAVR